jgi:hypothetical protein
MGSRCRPRYKRGSHRLDRTSSDCNQANRATGSLPIFFEDGVATATGFEDIVAYLRNYPGVTEDLDASLSSRQRTDRTALVAGGEILKAILTGGIAS